MTLAFSDTFTEASNTDLHLHTPDTGTSWTVVWQTAGTVKEVVNATVDNLEQAGGANSGAIYSADGTYDSADYAVEATFAGLGSGSTQSQYLFARLTDQENFYYFQVTGGGGTTRLGKKVAGTFTTLTATVTPPTAGDVIKLEVIGSTLKVYYNGVEQTSQTDTDITATGKAGIGMGGGAELVTSTHDPIAAFKLDDFSVNTTGAGPTVHERAVAIDAAASVVTSGTFFSIFERSVAVGATANIATAATFFTIFSRSVAVNGVAAIEVSGLLVPAPTTHERSVAFDVVGAITTAGLRALLRSVAITAAVDISVTPEVMWVPVARRSTSGVARRSTLAVSRRGG